MSKPPISASQNDWLPSGPATSYSALPQGAVSPQNNKPSKFVVVGKGILAIAVVLIAVYIVALNISPRIAKPVRPKPPTQNGFPMLVAATANVPINPGINDAVATKPRKTWTLAEKQAMIAADRVPMEKTREALRYPYYEENHMDRYDAKFPYYAKFRNMTRILTLAGNVAWEEGNQKEAVAYYLDGVTIGRRIPHRTSLIERLVGVASEAVARRALWEHLNQMNADTATAVLARLESLQGEQLPYWETLEEERYNMLESVKYTLEHPGKLSRDTMGASDWKWLDLYGRMVPRTYVTGTLGGYADKVIDQAKKPFMVDHRVIPIPHEPLTQILGPVLVGGRVRYLSSETGDTLLRTALALRIYRMQKGKYPINLSELVDAKILNQVPGDPFDLPGKPLRYKAQSADTYLLYSIGPDGVDDNGNGITQKSLKGVEVRYVNEDSKGDMVAGWYPY